MSGSTTRTRLFMVGLALCASTASAQIIILPNSQFYYLQSEARGSRGRVISPRVDPVMAAPFIATGDARTGPPVCDEFDFRSFQNAFVGGCP